MATTISKQTAILSKMKEEQEYILLRQYNNLTADRLTGKWFTQTLSPWMVFKPKKTKKTKKKDLNRISDPSLKSQQEEEIANKVDMIGLEVGSFFRHYQRNQLGVPTDKCLVYSIWLKLFLRRLENKFTLFEIFSGLELFLSISLLAWLQTGLTYSHWKMLTRGFQGIKPSKVERVKRSRCFLTLKKHVQIKTV